MCGINGIIDFGENDNELDIRIEKMQSALAHRGPDESGIQFFTEGVMGMTRLALVGRNTSATVQRSEQDELNLVFNGNITNYRQIGADLGMDICDDTPDTHVLVPLIEKYGDDFVDHLAGMFAIAVWNPIRNRLSLISDQLGIKPLYYAEQDGEILFSSEVQALRQGMLRNISPDFASMSHILTRQYHPGSVFDGIKMVPPGGVCDFYQKKSRERSYWDIPSVESGVDINTEKLVEQGRALLETIVQENTAGNVNMGCFVGGLDSMLIAGIVNKLDLKKPNIF